MALYDVTPEINYFGGVHPRLTQFDNIDFFRPELQTNFYDDITLSKTLFPYGQGNPGTVIGYSVPYNHYRYSFNRVVGRMAYDMQYWNVLHKYSSDPRHISVGRVHDETDTTKTNLWRLLSKPLFAVETEPQLYIESYLNVSGLRPVLHVSQDLQA